MKNTYIIVLRPDQQVRAMEKYCRALEKIICDFKADYKYNSFFAHKYASIVTEILKEDNILGADASDEDE